MSPMTYSGASCSSAARRKLTSTRGICSRRTVSTSSECCATEKICAPFVCPFQRATRASPWAMSATSMSSGEGLSRSSRRPESMRCHARGCTLAFERGAAIVSRLRRSRMRRVPVAGDKVVVHHADRLHEGIDDGRADELEATAGQLLRDFPRQLGLGRDLSDAAPAVHQGLAVDEVPEQTGESGPLLHHVEPGAAGAYRALDLHAIAHDAGVAHQPLDLLRSVARDLLRCEAIEGTAEILALTQDRDPGEPGLEAVEHKLLVERAVVVFRHAPFIVVIGDVDRILLCPGAAAPAVGMEEGGHSAAFTSPGQAKRAHAGLN